MKSFSQRQGLVPVSEIIQIESVSNELRVALWNLLDELFWSDPKYMKPGNYHYAPFEQFSLHLWADYFKVPSDTRPNQYNMMLTVIRDRYFQCDWNEVYDFIEFIVNYHSQAIPHLSDYFNAVLRKELSGYVFINHRLVNVTDVQESIMLEEALSDTEHSTVTMHLERALQLLSDRNNPDYRNSIKESISAVEAMARILCGAPKSSLNEALRIIETKHNLHPALKKGFSNLYGYTSDEDGIRHSMLEMPDIDQDDAKYFLFSCTSFINYLKSKVA